MYQNYNTMERFEFKRWYKSKIDFPPDQNLLSTRIETFTVDPNPDVSDMKVVICTKYNNDIRPKISYCHNVEIFLGQEYVSINRPYGGDHLIQQQLLKMHLKVYNYK